MWGISKTKWLLYDFLNPEISNMEIMIVTKTNENQK
jgi:hypothetical protein